MPNCLIHQMLTIVSIKNKATLGTIFALLATICWSFNFIAGRGFVNNIPPMTLVAIRAFIALLVLLPFAAAQIKRDWQAIRSNIKYLTLISLLGMGLPQTCIYMAAYTSSALNMSIISISTPLFVLILARIFYREFLSPLRVLGLCITIAGIVVLISNGNLATLLRLQFQPGDFFMLGNAIGFAIYTLLLRNSPKNIGVLSFLAIFTALGMLVVLPGAAWELASGKKIILSQMLLWGVLYTSLGATLLAFGLWSAAVKYAGATKSSIVYYSMPLFSGIEGVIFLDEPFLLVHFISMLLIMTGLILALHVKTTADSKKTVLNFLNLLLNKNKREHFIGYFSCTAKTALIFYKTKFFSVAMGKNRTPHYN